MLGMKYLLRCQTLFSALLPSAAVSFLTRLDSLCILAVQSMVLCRHMPLQPSFFTPLYATESCCPLQEQFMLDTPTGMPAQAQRRGPDILAKPAAFVCVALWNRQNISLWQGDGTQNSGVT